jgi:hypothetical protein
MTKFFGRRSFRRKNHFDLVKGVIVLGTVIKVVKKFRLPKIMKKVLLLATPFSRSRKFLQ